jgi:hypothetical protein
MLLLFEDTDTFLPPAVPDLNHSGATAAHEHGARKHASRASDDSGVRKPTNCPNKESCCLPHLLYARSSLRNTPVGIKAVRSCRLNRMEVADPTSDELGADLRLMRDASITVNTGFSRLQECVTRDEAIRATHELFGSDEWTTLLGARAQPGSLWTQAGCTVAALRVRDLASRTQDDVALATIQILSSYVSTAMRHSVFKYLDLSDEDEARLFVHQIGMIPPVILAWMRQARDWTTALHHVPLPHAFPTGRVLTLLREGASIHICTKGGRSPLDLAALHPDSPAAAMVRRAATWTSCTHELFPRKARELAESLVISLSHLHARRGLGCGITAQDFSHLILAFAITRD